MTTLLVTGGAGFIGSAFVRRCLADPSVSVVTLDALTYAGDPGNLAGLPRHELVVGDIGDRALVRSLLRERRPAAVVNLAAESHVDRSIDGPRAFVDTNVVGTFELLEACRAWLASDGAAGRGGFRFLHVSTDEVYGSLGPTGRFTESSPHAPSSPYAASKAAADHLVRAYAHTYGLPAITTNCSNNYGPRQFPEKLIPLMVLNALERRPLPVYGAGGNVRDWLHVDDHCDGLLAALRRGAPGRTYNLGGGAERTNLQVVHALCDLVDALRPDLGGDTRALVRFVADRPGHDLRYAVDATRAAEELGWRPAHDFDTGLRETVRWYLENRAWCERIASGVYRRERLGLGGPGA